MVNSWTRCTDPGDRPNEKKHKKIRFHELSGPQQEDTECELSELTPSSHDRLNSRVLRRPGVFPRQTTSLNTNCLLLLSAASEDVSSDGSAGQTAVSELATALT